MKCANCYEEISPYEPVYVIDHTQPVHVDCLLEFINATHYDTAREAEEDFKALMRGQ